MKKILILTSSGGGGTLAASTAIEEYLKHDYEITTIHIFNSLLKPIDFCSVLTFKKYSCEDIYNILIPQKCFRILTALYYIGKWYIQHKKKEIYTALKSYILNNKPNLIISVIPILNNIVLSVAQELDIPFLLIPTDLDIEMYIMNIAQPTHKKFHIGIPFDDKQLRKPLQTARIPSRHISQIGAAIKSSFFIKKNSNSLKQEFCIPENKPVIMLMMGAQGSYDIKEYVNQLLKITHSFHLIVCTGKNDMCMPYLIPQHISISIIPFTSRIADLMALSDIIITKSGSLSVCEALYMNKPIILDATTTILPWERLNHCFIKTHQFGTSVSHYSDITSVVSEFLANPEKLDLYKKNLEKLEKKNIEIEIKKCIQNLI